MPNDKPTCNCDHMPKVLGWWHETGCPALEDKPTVSENAEPTCVVCGSDDPNVREKIGPMMPMKALRDDCYGSFHDSQDSVFRKPPASEKAEWERRLDELVSEHNMPHRRIGLAEQLRAAVQKALDERYEQGMADECGAWLVEEKPHDQAAAEKRAHGVCLFQPSPTEPERCDYCHKHKDEHCDG